MIEWIEMKKCQRLLQVKRERHCMHFQLGSLLLSEVFVRWNKAAFPLGIRINCGLANRPVSLVYKLVGNNSICLKTQNIWGMLPERVTYLFFFGFFFLWFAPSSQKKTSWICQIQKQNKTKNPSVLPWHTCVRGNGCHEEKEKFSDFQQHIFQMY